MIPMNEGFLPSCKALQCLFCMHQVIAHNAVKIIIGKPWKLPEQGFQNKFVLSHDLVYNVNGLLLVDDVDDICSLE